MARMARLVVPNYPHHVTQRTLTLPATVSTGVYTFRATLKMGGVEVTGSALFQVIDAGR